MPTGSSHKRLLTAVAESPRTRIGATSVATLILNASDATVTGALGVNGALEASSAVVHAKLEAGSAVITGAVTASSAAISGPMTAQSAIIQSSDDAATPLTVVKPGDGSLFKAQTTGGHGLEVESSGSEGTVRLASLEAGKTIDLWASDVTLSTGGAARARLHTSGRFDLSTHVKTFPLGQVALEIPSEDMGAVDHITVSHGGYYMGYVMDVFLTGGKDWGGHGSVTCVPRFVLKQGYVCAANVINLAWRIINMQACALVKNAADLHSPETMYSRARTAGTQGESSFPRAAPPPLPATWHSKARTRQLTGPASST